MDSFWDTLTPFHQVGLLPGGPNTGGTTMPGPGIERSAGPAVGGDPKPWHPDNPLFWFGLLAAVTFGLIGAATELKAGPFKASVSAGET